MQCDCEAVECGHEAGACSNPPCVKVEAFGHGQKLCGMCLALAQAFYDHDANIVVVGSVDSAGNVHLSAARYEADHV